MDRGSDTATVVREVFEDVALLIGGVASVHHLDDRVVWMLMKRLERIRGRTLCRLSPGKGTERAQVGVEPRRAHPAVERFLRDSSLETEARP